MRTLITAAALALVTTLPASAVVCLDSGPGVHMGFELTFGGPLSEADRNELDLMRLRQTGVDATAVERWGTCLRAWVRRPGGGEEMQFFDPRSLRRVE